jgi:predicted amidophosphoribosyltransferase
MPPSEPLTPSEPSIPPVEPKIASAEEVSGRRCAECGAVIGSGYGVCDQCGQVYVPLEDSAPASTPDLAPETARVSFADGYCPNCATEVDPKDTECPNCGAKAEVPPPESD